MQLRIILFLIFSFFLIAQEQPSEKTKSSEKESSTAQSNQEKTTESDEKKENLLEEFVVTATRTKKSSFDLPYSTTTINAKELRRKKPRSLPEALSEVPGVMIQKTSHGQGSPYLRGFTGFRTVLLIDGIRLNNSVFREGPNQYWSTVDPLSLDRLEVVRGPASVLYGSDAVGGAVQAFTKERKLYKKPFQANGLLSTRVSSAEASIVTRVEGSANVGETFGMLVGQNYKQFGDIDAGGGQGRLKRTGYYELDADGKFNFFINPNLEITAAYYLVEQENIWRTHRTIFSESFRDTTVGTELRHVFDQERHLAYLRVKTTDPIPGLQNFTLTGSYHYQEEVRERLRDDRRLDFDGFKVSTGGIAGQFTSDSPIGVWTYGFDYYRDFVNSRREDFRANGIFASRTIQGAVADDATYDLLGVYLQNEVPFHPRFKGIFGVRYTHAWVDAEEVVNPNTGNRISIADDWGAFVGNAQLIATVHKNVNIYVGANQSFRAPNLSDLTRFDTARSGEVETPSPDLDPEKFLSLEAGLNTKSEYFEGHLAYYYTFVEEMIIRFPTGNLIDGDPEIQKDNAGDGYIHGFECSGEVFLPKGFSIFGNAAWLEGRISTYPDSTRNEEDESLDKMQPAQGLVGIRWHNPEYGLTFELSSRMTRQQKRLTTADRGDTQRIPPEGTPGYGILTLRGEWEINEYVTISATLDNILDKHYRVHASGQDETGFNAIFGVDVTF